MIFYLSLVHNGTLQLDIRGSLYVIITEVHLNGGFGEDICRKKWKKKYPHGELLLPSTLLSRALSHAAEAPGR